MKSHHHIIALVAMCLAGPVGCTSADDQDFDGQNIKVSLDPQAGSTLFEPPRGRNGLKPSEFWSETAQLAYRDIQHHPLKSGTIWVGGVEFPHLNAQPGSPFATLLATYPKAAIDLIECALDDTQIVYDSVTGSQIQGWFGLATDWYNTPINTSPDVQEFLTACMLARLNKWGIQVDILLEGDTSAIQTDPALDLIAPYEESNVHGNMFNSTKAVSNTAPAFNAYLCRENYLASACPTDQGAAYASKRICDNVPHICGLVDIGLCDPATIPVSTIPPAPPPPSPSCVANGAQYWKCKDGSAGTIHKFRTVGIQLEAPIDKNSCY